MDCVENTLVVGTAQRKILIWDLRNWGTFRSISKNLIRLSIFKAGLTDGIETSIYGS